MASGSGSMTVLGLRVLKGFRVSESGSKLLHVGSRVQVEDVGFKVQGAPFLVGGCQNCGPFLNFGSLL